MILWALTVLLGSPAHSHSGTAVDVADCSGHSERSLLLSQAEDKGGDVFHSASHALPHRPSSPRLLGVLLVPAVATISGPLYPTLSSSSSSSASAAFLAPIVRRPCSACVLLLLVVLAAALIRLSLVADDHGRWQLLAAQLLRGKNLLLAVQAELTWDATLLLSGSRLQACIEHRAERDGQSLDASSQRFADASLTVSHDGQSYAVSATPPLVFSPHYLPSASSPYAPARILACSTNFRRCDAAVVELFQADLVAEMSSSSSSASLPTFCTGAGSANFSTAACEDWPFRDEPSAAVSSGEAQCGSGVLNLQESQHAWVYRHPMSCIRLARSIGMKHGYCVGRDAAVDEERVNFHLAMFGPVWRSQATLAVSSFLLTQNLSQCHLLIWTDRAWSELSGVSEVQPVLSAFALHVEVRVWDGLQELINSNSLLSSSAAFYASIDDSRGWLRGDLMRLLLLHNYGGLYYDADVLLLRDLGPLLGQQFLYKWGDHCAEINGAVMRLFKRSALSGRFLDALYHTPPIGNSMAWGNELYSRIRAGQRSLGQQSPEAAQPTAASLRSEHFTLFPACFFNPNWMEPAPFSPLLRPELPRLWPTLWHGPFAYHLHGEVWDDDGFTARDPTYLHVAARIRALMQRRMRQQAAADTRQS